MRAPWSRVAQGKPKFPRRERPATREGRNTPFGLKAVLAESQHAGQRTGGMLDRAWFEIVGGLPARRHAPPLPGHGRPPQQARQGPRRPRLRRRHADGGLPRASSGVVDVQRLRGTLLEVEAARQVQTAAVHAQRVPIHIEQEGGSAGEFVIDAFQRSVLCGFPV